MDLQEAIYLYASVTAAAVPISIAFAVGNLIVDTFLRMAFDGKLLFKRGK